MKITLMMDKDGKVVDAKGGEYSDEDTWHYRKDPNGARVKFWKKAGYTFRTLPIEEALRVVEAVQAERKRLGECYHRHVMAEFGFEELLTCKEEPKIAEADWCVYCRNEDIFQAFDAATGAGKRDYSIEQILAAKQAQKDGTMVPIKQVLKERDDKGDKDA